MSFRKRPAAAKSGASGHALETNAATTLPPGVRSSANSGAPVTSWGLRAIDTALGGGLPLGTLTVVIEDEPSAYHLPLCTYVVAQGVQCGHAVAVASFDTPAERLLSNLPACVDKAGHGYAGTGASSAERRHVAPMEIAWRYQKNADPTAHIVSGDSSRSFAYDFDLSQSAELPKGTAISCLGRGVSGSLDELAQQLYAHLEKAAKRKLLSRIVIHGLSPAHFDDGTDSGTSISKFLSRVRGLSRVFGAVAVVSCTRDVPYRGASVSSDAVLRIDSFGGRGAGVAGLGKEWLGVMIVNKTYRDGRGPSLRGKGDVWVFKRGRRKYVMERATAAPDEDDDTDIVTSKGKGLSGNALDATKDGSGVSGICGTKPESSRMDF